MKPVRQMGEATSVRALLAPMSTREVDLAGETFQTDRSAALTRMAHATPERGRRWPSYASIPMILAAAVALVAVGSVWRQQRAGEMVQVVVPPGSAIHFDRASGETMREGGELAGSSLVPSRGSLETPATSGAKVTTSDGLAIELESDTRVAIGALRGGESRLDLRRGGVRCSVAHRPATRPFRVVTPAATVVDLGTIFTVRIDATTGATRVEVEEGEVLVERGEHGGEQTRVKAPAAWSSADASAASGVASQTATPPPVASPPPPTPVPLHAPPPETRREPNAGHASSPAKPPASTLDEESRLLRLGLAAERQAHPAEALSRFEQLLSRYPKSPLAPDARAARQRVKQNLP